jgi:hypothetical protein
LYNEELHNLYSSPDIIRVIKSRRMELVWHGRYAYKILVGTDKLEDLSLDGSYVIMDFIEIG